EAMPMRMRVSFSEIAGDGSREGHSRLLALSDRFRRARQDRFEVDVIEARATHQGAVDSGQGEDFARVCRLDRPTIENANASARLAEMVDENFTDMRVHLDD